MYFKKQKIVIILVIFITLFLFALFAKPFVLSVIKKQLIQALPGSRVSIGSLAFRPWGLIALDEVRITRVNAYSFGIKALKVYYNLFSLLRRTISRIYIKDLSINIEIPESSLSEFKNYLSIKSQGPPWAIGALEVYNTDISIKSRDLSLNAKLTLEANIIKRFVNYLNFKVGSCEAGNFKLSDALFTMPIPNSGKLYIKEILYDKFQIKELKSKARLSGSDFFLKAFSAKVLDGIIEGELALTLDVQPRYSLQLKVKDINLKDIAKDFKLEEKVEMSGRLKGGIELKGRGLNIELLSGGFSLPEPGGLVTIKDKKILENIAQNTNQSLQIIIDSFQNYHYNIGRMGLSFEGGNLVFNVFLEGASGKRNISITVHDFKLGREGP